MRYQITLRKELLYVVCVDVDDLEQAEEEARKREDRTDLADYDVIGGSVAVEQGDGA